jgi:hypothetical protein
MLEREMYEEDGREEAEEEEDDCEGGAVVA